jgi:hypothetical protein
MGLEQKLPKWFDGTVYDTGDIVTNLFSGEEYKLNNIELSIYDLLMGINYIGDHRGWDDEMIDIHSKCLDWFRENNSKAYMILLD